jgi:hypothetical protein
VSYSLQVVEELDDAGGVKIREGQFGRSFAGVLLEEIQQQPEGIAVAGDGSWTGIALRRKPIAEELLEKRRETAF